MQAKCRNGRNLFVADHEKNMTNISPFVLIYRVPGKNPHLPRPKKKPPPSSFFPHFLELSVNKKRRNFPKSGKNPAAVVFFPDLGSSIPNARGYFSRHPVYMAFVRRF